MKKISMTLAACAMAISGSFLFPLSPAIAQVPIYTCEAKSPSATGVWMHTNADFACLRAKQECAARSPYWETCYVSRWWVNY